MQGTGLAAGSQLGVSLCLTLPFPKQPALVSRSESTPFQDFKTGVSAQIHQEKMGEIEMQQLEMSRIKLCCWSNRHFPSPAP